MISPWCSAHLEVFPEVSYYALNSATVGLLRYAAPELYQLQRELGLLHIKCHTFYERYIFIKRLREKWVSQFLIVIKKTILISFSAEAVLGSFDLSSGKSVEEAVSVRFVIAPANFRFLAVSCWQPVITSLVCSGSATFVERFTATLPVTLAEFYSRQQMVLFSK